MLLPLARIGSRELRRGEPYECGEKEGERHALRQVAAGTKRHKKASRKKSESNAQAQCSPLAEACRADSRVEQRCTEAEERGESHDDSQDRQRHGCK